MIKRIELINFMSHSHTVIEPADGLTVLIGPNNCGKSAVVAALQILAHNANSTYVCRHNEKLCEIIVETDDGHTIHWSRTRTGSPKYVIDGQDFDRLRGNVPLELNEILRLPKVQSEKDDFDIHFGQQKDPVFLLNDSGKAAAQFFASSSDASRLVEMQDRHKRKIRESKRDHKRLSAESEDLSAAIAVLEQTTNIDAELGLCESNYQQLNQHLEESKSLENLISNLRRSQGTLKYQSAVVNSFVKLVKPPRLEPTLELEKLIGELVRLGRSNAQAKLIGDALATVAPVPDLEPVDALAELMNQIQLQQQLFSKTGQQSETLQNSSAPPTLENEETLGCMIANMKQASQALSHLNCQSSQLQNTVPPPAIDDTGTLQSLIESISNAQKTAKCFDSDLKKIEIGLAEIVAQSKDWANENPNCPTCGAETNAQSLLNNPLSPSHERGCHG